MKNRMNLLQLLKDNADKPRSWSLKAEGEDATLYVYDVIGGLWGGVDAEEVARALAATTASTIHVRINSPGGDVFEARAITTALRQHQAEIIVHIDGWAASAATTIATAGDRVEIAQGGMYMIHNAWTLAMGNRHDMLDTAGLLEKVDAAILQDYAARTGATPEQIAQWMDDETWFSAEEAVEHGFADELVASGKASAKSWNLSAYRNPPKIEEPDRPDLAALERRLTLLENVSA